MRDTDVSEEIARHRYSVFLKHYRTIEKLKDYFTFTVINAMGDVDEVQQRIKKEFAYQSSTELSQETFDLICDLPTVEEARRNARQLLVSRLDEYVQVDQALFLKVVAYLAREVVPAIAANVIGGECWCRMDAKLMGNPLAQQMFVVVVIVALFAKMLATSCQGD